MYNFVEEEKQKYSPKDKRAKKGGENEINVKFINCLFGSILGTIAEDMCKYFHEQIELKGVLVRWISKILKFYGKLDECSSTNNRK